ncbi:MAG TPA: PEGA domain-containing protein [Alphaproteobacteria bacterium]|jgi:hypothetical protein|nr:PEGA domain-containing protein [Alphaproteobacteria bacterium]
MQTLKVILITLLVVIVLGAVAFFLIGYLKPKPGGISVITTPVSNVYVNNVLSGKTPFKGSYEAGILNLKLVPETSDQNLIPFETKLTLSPGIETVVRREFGKTEDESSGDVISFEKETGKNTSLVIISTPDNAQVSLDGVPRGFTPYKTSTISPAKHKITIAASGYTSREMTVETRQGFRLTVFAKLSKTSETENVGQGSEATPSAQTKSYVEILTTPTGFLRVRTEPGSGGEEIAEVKPGSKYPYLDTDTATGWFKIQYQDPQAGLPNGIVGWISNEFARKVDKE